MIADRYQGKRLNSPNDVVVKSDGSIWFTDPAYGIDSDYEGHGRERDRRLHVYRVDPAPARCASSPTTSFGPTASPSPPTSAALRLRHRRQPAGRAAPHPRLRRRAGRHALGRRGLRQCTAGGFDGFRFDDEGRIWASAGDGVHCYDPDGTLIGKVLVPETVANVVFGGPKRNRLFICATTSLYAVLLAVNGAKTF